MARLELQGLRNTRSGPFNLTLEPGSCIAVTGPSGAGKSVLLRMIADLDPSEGDVLLDDVPRARFSGPDWRARVVYAAAEPGWWHEDVAPHFPDDPAINLERLGLRPGVMHQPVRLCSTGERQRLALIRSLARHPAALLLDEPTSSLDMDGVRRVEKLLRGCRDAGTCLLLVTHDMAQAARVADCHLILRDGRFSPA